jgi:hypothetical protein
MSGCDRTPECRKTACNRTCRENYAFFSVLHGKRKLTQLNIHEYPASTSNIFAERQVGTFMHREAFHLQKISSVKWMYSSRLFRVKMNEHNSISMNTRLLHAIFMLKYKPEHSCIARRSITPIYKKSVKSSGCKLQENSST